MSEESQIMDAERRAGLYAQAGELRPELHRYCARLMGSVIDGEDVVQDTLVRAFTALQQMEEPPVLRSWLFRIAHNRALDLIRGRSIRVTENIDEAIAVAEDSDLEPDAIMMRDQAVNAAVTQFTRLPHMQRSAVILKDVLDESLVDIASLMGLTVDAVKGHLARGRSHLRQINAQASAQPVITPPSDDVKRYVSLFNERNWSGLRALLANDVKLNQATHPLRSGSVDVGMFFSIYAKIEGAWLAHARLEEREVIAVYRNRIDSVPSYFMWLEWRDGLICFIHDYRYVDYVLKDAEILITPELSDHRGSGLSEAPNACGIE